MYNMKLFRKIMNSNVFTRVILLCLTVGVWAVFIQNIVYHHTTHDVYVANTVDTHVVNTVDVDVNSEVDVNVEHWNGHRVGSHQGYTDNNGYKHVAIDVYKNGGW